MPDDNFSWIDAIPSVVAGFFFIAQMFYGFMFVNNPSIVLLTYVGIGVFLLSGVFGMVPVLVFPRKGGVKKGKSFVHTTTLVDTGIYAVVRHPQYSAFMLWALGAMLLFQHWVVVVLGIPVIVLTYIDMMREDKRNIQKFGDRYKDYMKRVPRVNVIIGILRVMFKR
jgi:protein-S-isoprenylcysteine O-methyltransferase Ste14